ncbi:unnamed protein product [Eretmochelys imbricata]
MASALTILLLGCWLAGQIGISGPFLWSRPSISVCPSGVIAPGAAVTIHCQCWCWGRRLFLDKDGIEIWDLSADGDEFTIPSARWEDAGAYSCRSHAMWEPPNWSYASDIVRIMVAETYYPKPAISLRPSVGVALGGAVTIQCRGWHQNVRFLLYKVGNPNTLQGVEPAGDMAEFSIRNVSQRDAGTYSCRYCTKSDPSVWSEPSDPVELVVAEPSYPKPSISLSPSGGVSLGGAVSVWCRGQRQGVRFVLNKEGRHFPAVDSSGFGAVFFISNVSREHGGSYNCSYHSRSEPFTASSPSDPVELVVRGSHLTQTLHPTEVTAPGTNVTIRCRGQRRDVRFFLHKAGDLNPPRHMDPAGDGAEFHIPTVGRQHGGSYGCSYRPRSEPFVSSQPSHPVELVVAAPPYFSYTNIARLGLGALVLLVLWLILAEAYYSCLRGAPQVR